MLKSLDASLMLDVDLFGASFSTQVYITIDLDVLLKKVGIQVGSPSLTDSID